MRKIISVLLLVSASAPAFAITLPEPGTLSLFGIGALGLLLTARKKQK